MTEKPATRKPITLPTIVAGLIPVAAADDFGQEAAWRAKASAAAWRISLRRVGRTARPSGTTPSGWSPRGLT